MNILCFCFLQSDAYQHGTNVNQRLLQSAIQRFDDDSPLCFGETLRPPPPEDVFCTFFRAVVFFRIVRRDLPALVIKWCRRFTDVPEKLPGSFIFHAFSRCSWTSLIPTVLEFRCLAKRHACGLQEIKYIAHMERATRSQHGIFPVRARRSLVDHLPFPPHRRQILRQSRAGAVCCA